MSANGEAPAVHALTGAASAAALPAVGARPVPPDQPWGDTSLQHLRSLLQQFAAARDWGKYHTPRNLMLALTGEVGELAEIFQWRGEVECGLPGFTEQERRHVGEELSDVLLYLVRLADACGIDLPAAALSKLEANGRKYPVHLAHGSAAKYTELAQQAEQQQADQEAEQQAQQQDGRDGEQAG